MALVDDKAAAIGQLYQAAANRLNELTAPYSIFEQVAWSLKLGESESILADAGHTGLLLPEAMATLRHLGITEPSEQQIQGQLAAMAQGISTAANQLMLVEAEVVGWRSARKYQIEQAPTSEALNQIDLSPPV